jgi:hypothetical protein
MSASDLLLEKIKVAVKAANEAEATVETAKSELVSRSKAVALLLLEAKRLHPKVADFESFLGKVHGLKLSRAYDLLRLAGGRTTEEEIRRATKERVKKHRKKKRELPPPPPAKDSVTSPNVTESPRITGNDEDPVVSGARRTAAYARQEEDAKLSPEEESAKNLLEFQAACKAYLPHLIEADLKKALVFFMEGSWKPRTKREAA